VEKVNVGANIKAKREEQGLTKEELARRSKSSGAAIHYFESGEKMPSLNKLCVIADVLNCSIVELLGENRA
jgi:transcriptional regulator with XRE-family HTH domain